MKKRLFGIMLIAAMFASVCAGCSGGKATKDTKGPGTSSGTEKGSTSTTEPVALTVWCWDPAFNIFAMETAAELYKKENPNVTVNVVETAWEDIQTKLTTAVTSGQTDLLPDILLMQDSALAKNITNYPDTFYDLTNTGIDFGKFASFKTALGTIDGKNYSVPFDNGSAITCLRTDILKEAGFTINDFENITWKEFIEKGKVVLEKTGKPLLSNQAGSPDLLMLMMQSAGTWVLDENGKPNFTDNQILKEVVDTYVELVKSGVLIEVNDWDQYVSSFNSSTVAGAMNGCWIIASITAAKDQSGLWGVTNVPKLSSQGATNYSSQGGSSWMVCSNSKNPEIAADFLGKTFGGSVELYETILPSSGALATYLPAGESSIYAQPQEYFGGDAIYAKITEYASKVPQVSYGVYNYEARDSIGAAITKIVGGADYNKAITEAQTEVEFIIGQ